MNITNSPEVNNDVNRESGDNRGVVQSGMSDLWGKRSSFNDRTSCRAAQGGRKPSDRQGQGIRFAETGVTSLRVPLQGVSSISRERDSQPVGLGGFPTVAVSPFTGQPRVARAMATGYGLETTGGGYGDAGAAAAPPSPAPSLEIPLGTFTVVHPDSDEYETVKIEYVTNEGSGLFGKLIASHISGPDNSNDFQGFAFIDQNTGEVRLWKRFASIDPRWIIAIHLVISMNREQRLDATQAYALRSGRCARCGHKLTVPASLHRGYGPDCWAQLGW